MTNSKADSRNNCYYVLPIKCKKDKSKARRKRQEQYHQWISNSAIVQYPSYKINDNADNRKYYK